MKFLHMGMRLHSFSRIPYSRLILALATLQLSVGVVLHILWIMTGNFSWLRNYFDCPGAIYFIFLDAFKLWLCIVAWKQFQQKESMGPAWFAISLAMGFQLAGDLLKHWLAVDTYINPLHYVWPRWNASIANLLHVWGSAIAGPLFMAILAVGLFKGLQHCRKIHMLGSLRTFDLVWVGGVAVYALYVMGTVIQAALSHPSTTIQAGWVVTWPNDILLAVLLFEAILLMRTVVDMGQGYFGRAWGAFAVAIFLTSIESLGNWLAAYGYFPYPGNSVLWYIWFIWAAAFALGPAYQVDAIRMTQFRAADDPDPLYNPDMQHAFSGK